MVTEPYDVATETPKKKKKRDKLKSETKVVDEEPMQADESPAEPPGARSPVRLSGYFKLTLTGTPASQEPERKKKRKKHEDASEDNTSKKERRKRRKTDGDTPESLAALVPSTSPTLAHTPVSEPSNSEIEEYLQSNSITLTAAKNGLPIKPVISFDQLQIPPELKTALSDFQNPTPIQACSWPPALRGQDVVGIAETGRYDNIHFITSYR